MKKGTGLLLAAGALALLAAEGWLFYRFGLAAKDRAKPAVSAVIAQEEADPLTRFRTEREQLRAREAAQLNDIIYNASTDAETLRQSQQQLLNMLDEQSREVKLEGLLQSRGFGDVLVSVSGESVNVLLRREGVTQAESAVILEAVMRETGATGGNVKIIPVK